VVVGAGEEHGFVNTGPGQLDMACIHAHGTMITEWSHGM